MASSGRMHIIYQALGSMSVGMGGMVSALTMGYTSPALPSMQKDPQFSITVEDGSWIGAVMPACALLGSLAAGPMLDNLGRRKTLMFLTLPFALSWAIIALSHGVGGVILGRMLGGVCVGVQAVAGSVYMPELVQLDLRRIMVIFPSVLGTLGILVGNAAGQYLSWRELAWLGCLLCLPQSILLLPLTETPFFLTRSGKRDSSLVALRQLRQTNKEVEKEQHELEESCKSNQSDKQSSGFNELFHPPNLWPVAVGIAMMVAQQTTGINAVIFYSTAIFEAGGDWLDPNTASTLLGLVNFISVFVSMYFTATCKRRYIMSISTWATVIPLVVLAAFFWLQQQATNGATSSMVDTLSFVPVISLLAYIFGFGLAWGPVPWIFLGEGMPSSVRGSAVAFVVAVSWGSTFLVTKTFQWCISLLGIHYTFLGYAVVTGISGILILRSMPETFGMSNTQMDNLYIQQSKLKKQ